MIVETVFVTCFFLGSEVPCDAEDEVEDLSHHTAVMAESAQAEAESVMVIAADVGQESAEQEQEEEEAAASATASTEAEPEPEPEPQASHSADVANMAWDAQVIAACESGSRNADGTAVIGSHDWAAVNAQGSSASGAFQFLDGTWAWVSSEIGYGGQYARAKHAPPQVQYEAFRWLADNEGLHHWNPSRGCWSQML